MMKVKAKILTDVEYMLDATTHTEAKRQLQERLAVDGYKNSEIKQILTEVIKDIDVDFDLSLDEPVSYMYGKLD